MRNLIKYATLMCVLAVFAGCGSKGKSQTGAMKDVSGAVVINEWQVMAIGGVQWGDGTLFFNDGVYKFKVSGIGVGGIGIHKITAEGTVHDLSNISDFSGTYFQARAGLTVGKGIGELWIKNSNGVTIKLKARTEGVALALGIDGLTIKMD